MHHAKGTLFGFILSGMTVLAVAVLLHVVVIGLLSVQWTRGDRRFDNPPMEVDLVAETAPQSTAPVLWTRCE